MSLSSLKKNNFPKKAIILAGGKGTRLYPITKEIPKSLLPVKRKPILNYLVNFFYSYGIKEITILINKDFREDFNWWLKKHYPKNKIKFIEEKKPLGTFGGLWYLKDWLGRNPFFLINGDDLQKVNLSKMNVFHQKMVGQAYPKPKPLATIALVKVPDPQNYGVVICQKGIVQKFLEKPKKPSSKYISSGLYLLSPEVFNYHPGPKFSMIEKNLFPKLAKEKKLAGFKFNGPWMDCGDLQRWATAIRKWNPK